MDRPDAKPPRETPFDALLVAAEHDPEAAEGLAQAYAQLGLAERRALIESVLADASAADRSPAVPLALLLAVESDHELARSIAHALVEAGREERAEHRAWSWGTELDGGIAVARPLSGGIVEVVALSFRDGELGDVQRDARVRREQLNAARQKLGVPDAAESMGVDHAIDRLAERLWRARVKRGSLPENVRALASFFAPY